MRVDLLTDQVLTHVYVDKFAGFECTISCVVKSNVAYEVLSHLLEDVCGTECVCNEEPLLVTGFLSKWHQWIYQC